MTIALVSRSFSLPSSPLTTTLPGERMLPSPKTASILFFLNRKATPLTLAATVSSLCFISAAWSSFGAPTTTPSGAKPVRRLLEHLGGVEQRLRGDAADVEAGPAQRLALLDHGHFQAELGRADGADIPPGAGADDDEIIRHGFLLVLWLGRVWLAACSALSGFRLASARLAWLAQTAFVSIGNVARTQEIGARQHRVQRARLHEHIGDPSEGRSAPDTPARSFPFPLASNAR